jgi:hypothetical protein
MAKPEGHDLEKTLSVSIVRVPPNLLSFFIFQEMKLQSNRYSKKK